MTRTTPNLDKMYDAMLAVADDIDEQGYMDQADRLRGLADGLCRPGQRDRICIDPWLQGNYAEGRLAGGHIFKLNLSTMSLMESPTC